MAIHVKYYGKYACAIHLNATDHSTLDAEKPGVEITHIYKGKFDINFTGAAGTVEDFETLTKQAIYELKCMRENLESEIEIIPS